MLCLLKLQSVWKKDVFTDWICRKLHMLWHLKYFSVSNSDVKNKNALEYTKKRSVFCIQAQCKKPLLNTECTTDMKNIIGFGLGNTEKVA